MAKLIKNNLVIIGVLAISLAVALSFPFIEGKKVTIPISPTPGISVSANTTLIYKGEEGKDALTILKEKAKVEQEASGLVVSIDGRKADDKKREYWGFYVNGEMASVGPAEYQTKDSDTIMWKIEKY